MIRQLGNPTWFCSFSAAETRCIHLIKILGRLIDNRDYSDDEVTQMKKGHAICRFNFPLPPMP